MLVVVAECTGKPLQRRLQRSLAITIAFAVVPWEEISRLTGVSLR